MKMDYIRKWLVFITLFGFTASQTFDTSFLNQCSKRDPQINTCLKATFNNLRPYLARGIPEIGIPPMEPLKIDQLALENNAGNIRIKGLFTKIVSIGASNFTVKEVRSDVAKLRMDMSLYIPHIESRGRYEVIGQVLLLPVRSKGEFIAEFNDMNAIVKLYGSQITKNNDIYMKIDKLVVDFVVKGARFKVKDVGVNQLNEVINQFLNQNAHELVQEMRPAAANALAKEFKKLLDSAFAALPMKLWLSE